jgi:hypothetical protein
MDHHAAEFIAKDIKKNKCIDLDLGAFVPIF